MYGIVHGGCDAALRRESVERLLRCSGFGGLAVGGALGATLADMRALLGPLELPAHLPRHLLGIVSSPSRPFSESFFSKTCLCLGGSVLVA